MKTWVMVWLWYLNMLYWPSVFWLDRTEARWALFAYLAIAPLAVLIILPQRGLTRLSGLMHVPWLVFVVMLTPRIIEGGFDGAFGIWLHLVYWSTLVCVVFDIVDMMRWFRGETYRLGTPAAVAAGASKAANSLPSPPPARSD